jgi:hypothetical protein
MAQRGQTLIVFALMMGFVFVSLVALVGDADVLMFQYDQANSAALLGAQAGASDVDLQQLYASNLRVLANPDAIDRCQQFGGQGTVCALDATGTVVTAEVTRTAKLPLPMFGASVTLKASRSARAVFGGSTPQ